MTRIKQLIQFVLLFIVTGLYAQQPFFEDFEQAPATATNGLWQTAPSRTWALPHDTYGFQNSYEWYNSSVKSNSLAFSGTNAAYVETLTTTTDHSEWLITPSINLSQYQSPTLKFQTKLLYAETNSTLNVYISTTSQTNSQDFQLLKQLTGAEVNSLKQGYQQISVNIPAQYINSSVHIAFVLKHHGASVSWLVDDVYVGNNCTSPTQIAISDLTTTSAKIAWDNTTNSTTWEIGIYGDSDTLFTNLTTVTNPFFTATNTSNGVPLQPGKTYRAFIRSICSSGTSNWSNAIPFTLASLGNTCLTPIEVPPTLPYISAFNSYRGNGGYNANAGTGCGSGSSGYLNGNYTIFKYTPTTNTTININVQGAAGETNTALFIYNSCSNIGVNCLDSDINDLMLEKNIPNFPVTAGNTYYIVVATKNPNPNKKFSIIISNACSSNIESTFTVPNCNVSYTVNVNITNMGGATSLIAKVYGSVSGIYEQTINNIGTTAFNLPVFDSQMRILIQDSQNPNCYILSPEFSSYSCPPINDECQNAWDLGLSSNTHGGRLTQATVSSQFNNCNGSYKDVWYKFVATSNEMDINISKVKSGDIIYSLYAGSNCNALTPLNCYESNYTRATGLIVGQTYTIRVSAKTESQSELYFDISVKTPPSGCWISNSQSENIKHLFVNLLNALSKKQTTATPFTCPELTQLTPFITTSNPMIYNFQNVNTGGYQNINDGGVNGSLFFGFSNNSADILYGGAHMYGFAIGSPLKDITFLNNTDFPGYTMFKVTYGSGSIDMYRSMVKSINFCPAPCDPIGGKIVINPGVSCVATGAATPFALQTSAGNIANYTWIIYNDKMNPVASYYTANPTVTVNGSGTYMARLIVTTTTGCTTKFEKYFWVSKTCPSAGDENGNGIPDNTEPGSDPTNPGSGIPNNCALYNQRSEIVKDLYINLINHLFDLVTSGAPIPIGYSSPQVVALAPYMNGGEPILYNITYVDKTLKFMIAGGEYNIIVKNNGPINDIYLENFDLNGAMYKTTYINGSADDMHFIKNILFCTDNPCGEAIIFGSIEFSPNLNTIPPFSNVQLNLNHSFSNETVSSYEWKITDYNNAIIFESNESNPIVNIPVSNVEPHIITVVARSSDQCTVGARKLAFAPDINPSNYCSETNPKTPEIKKLLINLINRLYGQIYAGGQLNMPSTYTSEETTAFAPYNIYNSPTVYDVIWDGTTSTLKFSFYPNQPSPDVQIEMSGSLQDLAILVPYNDPGNYITAFALDYRVSQPLIKSIIFCPYDGENCTQLPGEIKLSSGVSCVQANTPVGFSISSDYTSYPYTWTFYNQTGTSVIGTSSEPFPYITYATPGNYLVKLEIDVNNCKSTFYKTVTVSASCGNDTGNGNGTGPYCTEANEDTVLVKQLFQTFLNSLFNLNGQIPNGYTNIELSALSPYITTPNPAVYNIRFSNNALSFSFSPNTSQPDVVIGNYGTVVDLNILNYSGTGNPSYIATYQDGRQFKDLKVNNVTFCTEQPCESHVAFVFDESASISNEEAQKIRIQLRAFVEQQLNSNMTVSFTGMADSDNYTRTDHVYDKITPATRYKFDNWINKYKTGYTPVRPGVSANSDYWASGLKQAMQGYSLIPEIVIMITDGSQTTNVPALKQQMANIANNEDSHLYIFGIGNGYYVNDTTLPPDPNAYTNTNISDVTPRLMSSIKYLMEMAPTEFPVSGKDNLLSADYFETKDFSEFGNELTDPNGRFFSDRLANANIGCGGEAIPLDFCYDCETFQPAPGQTYWLSAWATEEQNIQVKTFTNAIIKMTFLNQAKIKVGEISFLPEGDIIDGWQRFASKFEIPATATMLNIELENLSPSIPVYFDDIRIHPLQGSMKSFVYDPETFRLMAEQDDNNYSTFYEYDNEGGLVRIKKETSKGIKTIQETRSGSVIQSTGN